MGKYVYDKGLTRKTCLPDHRHRRRPPRAGAAGPGRTGGAGHGGYGDPRAVPPRCPWRRRGRPIQSGRWMWATHTGWCSAPRRRRSPGAGGAHSGGERGVPQRINVEFAAARTRERLEARVWERGAGSPWPAGRGPARCWRRRSGPAGADGGPRCGCRVACWSWTGTGTAGTFDDRPGGDRVRGGGGLKAALRLEKYKKNHSTNGIFSSILKTTSTSGPLGCRRAQRRG